MSSPIQILVISSDPGNNVFPKLVRLMDTLPQRSVNWIDNNLAVRSKTFDDTEVSVRLKQKFT